MSEPENATVPLRIEDVAFGGSGVGRAGGKAVFVPFTIAGEEVTARIFKQKKAWAQARLVSIEKPSGHRVQPQCPYFGTCGGCAYQHIAYAEQLAIKTRQVEQTLRRVGRFDSVPMRAIIASPKEYAYRNRIRVHVADGVIGFYAHDRHQLIDIEQCPISAPAVNAALRDLRAHGAVRDGDFTLADRARTEFFVQTNDGVAAALLDHVRGLVARDHEALVDAYCGAGFFAKGLRDLFPDVIGIEENGFAIEHARHDAQPHERYIAGDVTAMLGEILSGEAAGKKTTLILDPPAAGVQPRALDFILAAPPAEVIYVSCDPATLARDLAALRPAYRLDSVTPLDMFPQTAGIEVAAHLKR